MAGQHGLFRVHPAHPDEGKAPSERTEVRVLIGPDALYIGARMYDDTPAGIRANLVRRDAESASDRFGVRIDSRHDRRTAFVFEVNPRGVRRDGVTDASGNDDYSPDPVWQVGTSVDARGWTAEMRIPLSQLRFQRNAEEWGLQLVRYIQRKQEEDVFAFVPRNEQDGVARYGSLAIANSQRGAHTLEVAPYATASGEFTPQPAGNPFRSGSDCFRHVGADVKYGVTSSLTLDATINPDFGQVEVDPSVVNLSAYETFYPEKRPFFLEGGSLFNFAQINAYNQSGYPGVFYSRRIGRAPQLQAGSATALFTDTPAQTSIPVAVKLTGKTTNGWSIAAMDALTEAAHGRVLNADGSAATPEVEPLSNYLISRVQHEDANGNTSVGGLVTAVQRRLDDPDLTAQLRSAAYLGGIDFSHYWNKRSWVIDGFVTTSHVEGSADAITRTQRSSAHLYQRPDARHFHFDPTRTSLTGYNAVLALTRASGKHWVGSVTVQDKSPGYETNDMGLEGVTGRRAFNTDVGYASYKPGKLFRNYRLDAYTTHEWNYDGDNVTAVLGMVASARLKNFWQFRFQGSVLPQTVDDQLTRGGPLAIVPVTRMGQLAIVSDPRSKHWSAGLNALGYSWSGGHFLNVGPQLTLNPTAGLQVRFQPSYSINRDQAQYVRSVTDAQATATFGTRYVFAALDQKSLGLDTRVDWTLRPGLSLQFYGQPLIVAGAFADYKELRAPRSYTFDSYGRDKGTVTSHDGVITIDPDGAGPSAPFAVSDPTFNYRSLRGNVVLRWEYRPGSTVYLVWQQSRNDTAPLGDFAFHRDLAAVLHAPASNVIAVKFSYWLSL